jgi:hypothetical protein
MGTVNILKNNILTHTKSALIYKQQPLLPPPSPKPRKGYKMGRR